MAKKKNKAIIQPWCWYCEREFEDEKVLMQHQKAKHFKCGMCPRRLNTAGGLAVHIQQVHKLEPDNLPRIENALPGRDGYEVEIFGMEGIPAPDVADYKRRKEIEFGLAAGSISQPQPKRAKIEKRPMSETELKAALEAHKALMGANNAEPATPAAPASSGPIFAAPQAYAAPPTPAMAPTPSMGMPPPPGAPNFMPQQPFPPFPGMSGFPPGPPPPGFPPLTPGMMPPPPGGMPMGMPPPGAFIPPPGGIRPPFPGPPPNFVPAQQSGSASPMPPPTSSASITPAVPTPPPPTPAGQGAAESKRVLVLPNPSLAQTLPPFKKETNLKFKDANFSPEEHRSCHTKYLVPNSTDAAQQGEENRGKKRARAEDFL